MKKTTKIGMGVLAAAAVAGALVIVVPLAAQATVNPPSGSDAPFYIFDSTTPTTAQSQALTFTHNYLASSDDAANTAFTGSFTSPYSSLPTGDHYYVFVSPVGSERTQSAWNLSSDRGTNATTAGNNANVNLSGLELTSSNNPGTLSALAGTAGNFSLGLAAVDDGTGAVAWAAYTTIDISAGTTSTASYVWARPPQQAAGSNAYQVTAPVIASVDSGLGLESPAAYNGTETPVTLGAGLLSDGVTAAGTSLTDGTFGLSETTGQLGAFVVTDGRFSTHPGWTLSVTSTDFTDGSHTVGKGQLGFKAVGLASGASVATSNGAVTTDFGVNSTKDDGTSHFVTVNPALTAGTAAYPYDFAESDNDWRVGHYGFNADLTFLAPAATPAGSYVGTVTVTVTSK